MDTTDLHPLVEDLSANIDDLEESLAPLLNTALSASTSKLPLLDKAKLYVLATYAIESLLFSYLKLNGVDAKEHPIFLELTRVKEYFGKIKLAESAPVKRNTTLDKNAAGRFIKHGLSGNDEYDRKRAEQAQKEKAGAKRKFEDMTERVGSHQRFANMSRTINNDGNDDAATNNNGAEATREEGVHTRFDDDDDDDDDESAPQKTKTKSKKKRSKLETTDPDSQAIETIIPPKKHKSSKAPKGANEAFQALLKGPLPEQEGSKKKKRKSQG